jgi:hypothetical protein
MKIGAEDKGKVAALAVFGLVAVYMVYSNLISDGGTSSPAPSPGAVSQRNLAIETGAVPQAATSQQAPQSVRPPRIGSSRNRAGDEFHPFIHKKGTRVDEQQFDPTAIDPTLHKDLLAKVQAVKIEGGQRNLFQFGQAAPVDPLKLPGTEPIVAAVKIYGPKAPPPPPGDPPPPPPPTFAFSAKYYGIATTRINNKKTAFFLDGDDIFVAAEGELIKKRYRVVQIGVNSGRALRSSRMK